MGVLCSRADLCITHASSGCCVKQCSKCHSATLCTCACMRVIAELQKNARLFVEDRREGARRETRQKRGHASRLPRTFLRLLVFIDKCQTCCQLMTVCGVDPADSGPRVQWFLWLLQRYNWQEDSRGGLAKTPCCSAVWPPKHRRAQSFL